VTARLRSSGCEVELTRRAEHFARLHVVTAEGVQLDVDLGVDWRQDEPVRLAVGPVLSLDDAVGAKVGALYSRGEVRDYLDVDSIRQSGRFSDEQLLAAAADRDPGFRLDMFLWRLDGARRISPDDVERYGVPRTNWPPCSRGTTVWPRTCGLRWPMAPPALEWPLSPRPARSPRSDRPVLPQRNSTQRINRCWPGLRPRRRSSPRGHLAARAEG
jgi:hypothetical protein